MTKLSNILDKQGKEAVELYRNQLRENDRVATGKTNASIRYEVKSDSIRSTSLIVYGADHIRDLETGQTPEQIQANPPIFQQITEWANARGINRTANSIIRGLEQKGYEGTTGLITDIDKVVVQNVTSEVRKSSKSFVLSQIRSKTQD